MKKRVSRVLAIMLLITVQIAGVLVPMQQAFAAADMCTWTGATSANWSDGSNWTGCDNGGVPESGDSLMFPVSASNKSTNNDLSGLQLTQIAIAGSGYTLAGNTFTITSNAGIISNESATISASVNYNTGSHVNFSPSIGATLTLSGTSNFTVNSPYETNIGSSFYPGTVDFTGNITGSTGTQFIAVGGAKAVVRGASNTFTSTDVGAETNGIFECRSANCFGNNANNIYMGGGIVDLYTSATYANGFETSTSTPDDSVLRAHTNVSVTGNGTVNDALNVSQLTGGAPLQFTGAITNNSDIYVDSANVTAEVKFDGSVGGAGNFSFNSGAGSLGGSNTFTGRVDVANGAQLKVSNQASLGANTSGTYVAAGGALLFANSAIADFTEPFWIAGQGTAAVAGVLYNKGVSDTTLSGAITLTGDAKIANEGTTSDLSVNGVIGGAHDLTLYGGVDGYNDPGISLGGISPNIYTGTTYVTGGAVYSDKTEAIPGNLTLNSDTATSSRAVFYVTHDDGIADSSVVTLSQADDNFVLNNTTPEVIGGLKGSAGEVSFANSGANLIVDQGSDSVYDGNFYTDGGDAVFTKRGSGKLTLNGSDTFSPDQLNYIVEGGTLSVNGNLRTASDGDVTVKSGATLKGTGTVGAVDVEAGGILAPGNSPGTLNVTDLTLASGGTHQVEIAGDSSYDRIIATGTVNLSGALDLNPTYTPAVGTQFVIVQAGIVSGTFNGLPDGATVSANGLNFRIDYVGNGVTLTYLGGTLALPSSSNTSALGAPNTGVGSSMNAMALLGLGAACVILATAYFARRKLSHTR